MFTKDSLYFLGVSYYNKDIESYREEYQPCKKHFGKLLTLAAIVGAAAAGVSYVLQYKSFHKELDEDFHDFEDDSMILTMPAIKKLPRLLIQLPPNAAMFP